MPRRRPERKTTPKLHVTVSAEENNRRRTTTSATPNGTHMSAAPISRMRRVPSAGALDRMERETIVLWRHPFDTVGYALCELLFLVKETCQKLWTVRKTLVLILLGFLLISGLYNLPGAHQLAVKYMEKKLFWCFYWAGLGILSSIGLGTGLHTFLLYLGPHIASVTLAAFECETVKFPEPPYPDQIICPLNSTHLVNSSSSSEALEHAAESMASVISLWAIMSKVRLESIMWGAGTALGELPPYFMARAARLSGQEPDDEEYREFQQLMRRSVEEEEEIHWMDRAKLAVERIVERVGFLGILICASIPNPLFDLAGITCGHFLVPFWTFFGATLIGKAIVKMHIQQLFVIVAFSEHHVEKVISLIKYIPGVGKPLQAPFKEYLVQQKKNLHRKPGETVITKQSWLAWVFECIVILMVAYFILSLLNSLAQRYHKRKCQQRRDKDRQASLLQLQKID